MIVIFIGSNTPKRAAEYKKVIVDSEVILLSGAVLSKELMFEYVGSANLFGSTPVIVLENALRENKALFSADALKALQDSQTHFVFLEDKMLVADQKKYAKYATVTLFEEKKQAPQAKPNTFAIADAYGRRDKVHTWALYCQAIEKGIEPEAISGILFWKIKTLIQNGSGVFSQDDLKHMSGELVSLYHKAHKGECDFVVGLEQFILSNLSTPRSVRMQPI
jgi:hypothetical protein